MDASSNTLAGEVYASHHYASSSSSTAQIKEKTKRPQLSCNPCRGRKVKCDRIQPCTACSMHQIADQCQYDLTEHERQPILQAEALKERDREIHRLQGVIQNLQGHSIKTEPPDDDIAQPKHRAKPRLHQYSSGNHSSQRRLQSHFFENNIYFGSPSMAAVAQELAELSFHHGSGSLTHSIRSNNETQSFQTGTPYPFRTLWPWSDETSGLLSLLPSEPEILMHLDSFQARAQVVAFSHVTGTCTVEEVRRFLDDLKHNVQADPSMLALLFATIAQGSQSGVFDQCGQEWIAGEVERSYQQGDTWIAAAMQALRIASFLSRPTLLTIETLTLICSYLTNSGKMLDAWALLGTGIRLAQGIGLHRDPCIVDPVASTETMTTKKALWWSLLHIDQQYSLTLGRPLGVSSIGDCPRPEPLVLDPTIRSLATFYDNYSILGRQILSTAYMNDQHIDDFTEQLLLLSSTLPELLRFNSAWLDKDRVVPPWPFDAQAAIAHAKIHIYMLVLNRQHSDSGFSFPHVPSDMSTHSFEIRGRARVLDSCRGILHAFNFLYTRCRAALICWIMTQHAFNASMLLTMSMFETNDTQDLQPVQMALTAFLEMSRLGIHRLAGAAVERLNGLIRGFQAGERPKETVMGQYGMHVLETPGSHPFHDEFQSFQQTMPSSTFANISTELPIPPLPVPGEAAPSSSSLSRPGTSRHQSKAQITPLSRTPTSSSVPGTSKPRHSSASKKAVTREKRLPIHRRLSESSTRRSPKTSLHGKQTQLSRINDARPGDISLYIPEKVFEHPGFGDTEGPYSAQAALTAPIGGSFSGLTTPSRAFNKTATGTHGIVQGYHEDQSGIISYPFSTPTISHDPLDQQLQQTYTDHSISSHSQPSTSLNTPTDPNFNLVGFGGQYMTAGGGSTLSSPTMTRHPAPTFKSEYDDEISRMQEYRPYQSNDSGRLSQNVWGMGGAQQRGEREAQEQQQQQQGQQEQQHY